MEIYLDANATTPVMPEAQAAAQGAMADDFGNPSSVHSAGLRARALVDDTRAKARRVLGVDAGRLAFTSGATEAIQTAVLSALAAVRALRDGGAATPGLILFGATEHQAVPQAIAHWNALLGLDLETRIIPVRRDGRHDLGWLRRHAGDAALVCTMAANNETGVVSDLDGVAAALAGSPAHWLVDGVQALGKLPLRLGERHIDYACFSGHKLYAPKGIGLLYVREGAPFTPLIVGGGQEDRLRSGTENMAGIAALGAVFAALLERRGFQDAATLAACRDRLAAALVDAFPGLVFNAPLPLCLPTTLNFSVPGVGSGVLIDLFDAAEVRVSAGSACSAGKATPSAVLTAMGLPPAQAASAVRLSFGPRVDSAFIDEACARIRACGESLRDSALCPADARTPAPAEPLPGLVRFVADGACCYLLADAQTRRCVVIDPLPELTARLAGWITARRCTLAAVLDTHSHGDHRSAAAALRAAVPAAPLTPGSTDALGWPLGADVLALGALRLTRLATPGHTADAVAYLLHDGPRLRWAFVGDTVLPGALGRSDFAQSAPLAFLDTLRGLERRVGRDALLLPGHDYHQRFATTLRHEIAAQPLLASALDGCIDAEGFARAKAALEQNLAPTAWCTVACGATVDPGGEPAVEVDGARLAGWLRQRPAALVVDVREPYERRLGTAGDLASRAAPLSQLIEVLPELLAAEPGRPVVFFCRSGNRSAQAARALRRLGRAEAWSMAGGLARWSATAAPACAATLGAAL